MCIMCMYADSPGRDPNVISTSSHRSHSALGTGETGHKALVLKVQCISYSHHCSYFLFTLFLTQVFVLERLIYKYSVCQM